MAGRAKIQDLNHILTSPPSQVLTDDGHFKSRSPKKRDPTITINSSEYRSNDPTLILDGRLPTIASPKSNTNLSKMGASYLAENHNHRRTIFENKTEVDEVVKLPKKPQVETFKEISLPNAPRYDYSSQLLMYIPEDIHSLSAKETAAASGFNSFNQLSQSTKNSHHKLLEGILKQMKPPRSTEIYDQSPTQKQLKSYDNMDSVVKMLQLNKLQKKYYAKQIEVEKKHVVLPLIQQVQENESKTRRMPHVKKLPSRNIFNGNNMDAIIESPAAFERPDFYNSFDRSSFHTLTDIGSGDRRGSKTGSVDETFTNPMFGQVTYKVFWNFNMSDKNTWKPYCREGHTLTAVGRQIILYGGISNCVMGEITVYDPVKNLWSIPQVTGDIPLSGRHGHTACEYRRTLVIFGGEREFNPTLNFRECLNDAYMYIPDKNEWKYMKSSSSLINSRRHHTAAVHESSMYVYGGITNEGNYIKDVWSFNLKTCTWNQLEVEGDKENGIAFHGMSACAISRNGANFRDKERLKAYEEGLYTFGGKDSEGKILSSLKMLPIKTKEHKWKYLAAKGVAPTARYNHSMMFYEPLGIIIIYGGRNDSLFEATRDICLKDIRILNLETLTWTSTSSFGDLPQVGRYHHAVASYGTKMLIFGGVSLQSYANDEVRSVELNPAEVHKLLKEQQALDGVTTTVEYKKPKKNKAVSILKDRTEDEGPHKPMKPSKSVSINTGTMRTWQPIPMPRFGDDDHHVETKSNPNSPNKGGMTKVMRALTKVMPL